MSRVDAYDPIQSSSPRLALDMAMTPRPTGHVHDLADPRWRRAYTVQQRQMLRGAHKGRTRSPNADGICHRPQRVVATRALRRAVSWAGALTRLKGARRGMLGSVTTRWNPGPDLS